MRKKRNPSTPKYQMNDIVVDDDDDDHGACYNRPTEKQDMDCNVLHKICSMHVMLWYGVITFRFPLHPIIWFYFAFVCLPPMIQVTYFISCSLLLFHSFARVFFLSVWFSSLSECEKHENIFYVSQFAFYTHRRVLMSLFLLFCWCSQCLARLSRCVNTLQI